MITITMRLSAISYPTPSACRARGADGEVESNAAKRPRNESIGSAAMVTQKLPFRVRPEPVDGHTGPEYSRTQPYGFASPYIPGPFAPGADRVASFETASILRFVAAASARMARRCSIVSHAWNASRNSAAFCSIA